MGLSYRQVLDRARLLLNSRAGRFATRAIGGGAGAVVAASYAYGNAFSRPSSGWRSSPATGAAFLGGVAAAQSAAQAGDVAGAWRAMADLVGDRYAALSFDTSTQPNSPLGQYGHNMWREFWKRTHGNENYHAAFEQLLLPPKDRTTPSPGLIAFQR